MKSRDKVVANAMAYVLNASAFDKFVDKHAKSGEFDRKNPNKVNTLKTPVKVGTWQGHKVIADYANDKIFCDGKWIYGLPWRYDPKNPYPSNWAELVVKEVNGFYKNSTTCNNLACNMASANQMGMRLAKESGLSFMDCDFEEIPVSAFGKKFQARVKWEKIKYGSITEQKFKDSCLKVLKDSWPECTNFKVTFSGKVMGGRYYGVVILADDKKASNSVSCNTFPKFPTTRDANGKVVVPHAFAILKKDIGGTERALLPHYEVIDVPQDGKVLLKKVGLVSGSEIVIANSRACNSEISAEKESAAKKVLAKHGWIGGRGYGVPSDPAIAEACKEATKVTGITDPMKDPNGNRWFEAKNKAYDKQKKIIVDELNALGGIYAFAVSTPRVKYQGK